MKFYALLLFALLASVSMFSEHQPNLEKSEDTQALAESDSGFFSLTNGGATLYYFKKALAMAAYVYPMYKLAKLVRASQNNKQHFTMYDAASESAAAAPDHGDDPASDALIHQMQEGLEKMREADSDTAVHLAFVIFPVCILTFVVLWVS